MVALCWRPQCQGEKGCICQLYGRQREIVSPLPLGATDARPRKYDVVIVGGHIKSRETEFRFDPLSARRPSPDFANDIEAHQLLDLIDAEFRTDPMSVQCFDLRVVERVRACVAERKKLMGGK